jgi:PAS domain S-box-containing protein
LDIAIGGRPGAGEALELLRDVAGVLDAASSVAQAGPPILRSLVERIDADSGALWVRNPVTDSLEVACVWPESDTDLPSLASAERVLRGKGPISEGENGERSLGVPIRVGETDLGVLHFRGVPSDASDELIEAVALAAGRLGEFLRRLEAEERAALTTAALKPDPGQVPAITYFDALEGVSTTLYISPQTETMLGYTPTEWLEDPDLWARIIHPEDREWVLAENSRTMGNGEPFSVEYRMTTRWGEVRWFLDEAELVLEDGRQLFWRGHIVDITERKEAEGQLRDTEVRYRSLVENIPALTYIEEPIGRGMAYVSPQIEAMIGYTAQERMDDANLLKRLVHPEDREAFLQADARSTALEERFVLEYRVIAKDGRVVWLHDESVPVRDDQGRLQFWQGVAVDITPQRRAEEERKRLLSRLVSAQEEERARIAADIHDDPVQKMTAVGLRLSMLRSYLADPGAQEQVDRLQEVVTHATERLRGLMFELSPPQLEEDGLASALRLHAAHSFSSGEFHVEIEDRTSREPASAVDTIAFRIAQEAIANARKHAGAAKAQVELETSRGGLLVRVRDDGVGFEETDGPEPGHLGLTTMRERAETAGGWLKIASVPGRGTAVEFWLPDLPAGSTSPLYR